MHPGGNKSHWKDKEVALYDYKQKIINEDKDYAISSIARILKYQTARIGSRNPSVLDIGCGQGALTAQVLEGIKSATVTGIDGSPEMLSVAENNILPAYRNRAAFYLSDFNSPDFWRAGFDRPHDFIISSLALHFLSDARMGDFFRECFQRLNENGMMVFYITNYSDCPEIRNLEEYLKIEFAFQNLPENKRMQSLKDYIPKYLELESRVGVNWKSPDHYLSLLKKAGFRETDIVWRIWGFSIIVGIK